MQGAQATTGASEDALDHVRHPRLLMVGSALSGGGSETRFRLLAQRMFAGTADVAMLIGGGGELLSPGQTLYPLGWAGARSYLGVLYRLRRAVRCKPYDAVLSFGLYPNTLAWASVRALKHRPALIMTEITRPDTESRLTARTRHLLTHAVRRLTYPGADLCAANSEDGISEVVRHYGVARDRIRRVPNLVEPERLAELAAAPFDASGGSALSGGGTPSICIVSRLDPMKRIETLLAAAGGLPSALDWRIDIVGDGPERTGLEAMAAELGIRERVHFHGWRKNPYPAMRRATAIVLASAYEGFSNTVLEAMALGTPVITSYCSTDARLMHEAGAALGFPVGDHLTLREHLGRLLTDASLHAALSEQGRRYAERHILAHAVPEYEALVRDALKRRRGRS